MKIFLVHFIEDSYAFNDRELRTSQGERRMIYKIKADSSEEAYLRGVEKARAQTRNTFRLNSCKVIQE